MGHGDGTTRLVGGGCGRSPWTIGRNIALTAAPTALAGGFGQIARERCLLFDDARVVLDIRRPRHAIDERQGVDAKARLERGHLVELGQDGLRVEPVLHLDDDDALAGDVQIHFALRKR